MKRVMKSLPPLTVSENLGRSVFSSKARKRAIKKDTIDLKVFLEREEVNSLSVDRMDHATPRDMAVLVEARGRTRTSPRTFYGWAILAVENAEMNGKKMQATPIDGNRYHADIFLNITDRERRDRQKQHAVELAAHSTWQGAP